MSQDQETTLMAIAKSFRSKKQRSTSPFSEQPPKEHRSKSADSLTPKSTDMSTTTQQVTKQTLHRSLLSEAEQAVRQGRHDMMLVSGDYYEDFSDAERHAIFMARLPALQQIRKQSRHFEDDLAITLQGEQDAEFRIAFNSAFEHWYTAALTCLRIRLWVEEPLTRAQRQEQKEKNKWLEKFFAQYTEMLSDVAKTVPNFFYPVVTDPALKLAEKKHHSQLQPSRESLMAVRSTPEKTEKAKETPQSPYKDVTAQLGMLSIDDVTEIQPVVKPAVMFGEKPQKQPASPPPPRDPPMGATAQGGGGGGGGGRRGGDSPTPSDRPSGRAHAGQPGQGGAGPPGGPGGPPGGGGPGGDPPDPHGDDLDDYSDDDSEEEDSQEQEQERLLPAMTTRQFRRLIQSLNASNTQADITQQQQSVRIRDKPPKLAEIRDYVGIFDGNYGKWQQWSERWLHVAQQHRTWGTQDKILFDYLLECVTGVPYNKIKGIAPGTNVAYTKAWTALDDWYGTKRTLSLALYGDFYNLITRKLDHNSSDAVERLHDDFQSLFESYESLCNSNPYEWVCLIFLCAGESLLGGEAARQWAQVREAKCDVTHPFGSTASITDFLASLKASVKLMRREVPSGHFREQHSTAQINQKSSKRKRKDKKNKKNQDSTVSALVTQTDKQESEKTPVAAITQAKTQPSKKKYTGTCIFCKKDVSTHFSALKCPERPKIPTEKRIELIVNGRVCYQCCNPGHWTTKCTGTTCQIDNCGAKHCHELHGVDIEKYRTKDKTSTRVMKVQAAPASRKVLCKMLRCYVENPATGEDVEIRILIDGGSEVNAIRTDVADMINLKGSKVDVRFEVLGGTQQVFNNQRKVNFRLRSLLDNTKTPVMDAVTVPTITAPINKIDVDPKQYTHLRNLQFTEIYPVQDQVRIDILIGEPLATYLIEGAPIKGNSMEEPTAIKTVLGYTLAGSQPTTSVQSKTSVRYTALRIANFTEEYTALKQISEADHVPDLPGVPEDWTLGEAEAVAELLKNSYHYHIPGSKYGKWWAGLPINNHVPWIKEDNRRRAIAVCRSMDNKMSDEKYEEKTRAYEQFFENKFAELVPAEEIGRSEFQIRYHDSFPVWENRNTKCRIVFNPSSEDSEKNSLNKCLWPGPMLLPEMLSLLIRFRKHKIALTTDISRMFLRVGVIKQHRDLLRFVFTRQKDGPIQHARLTSLGFGLVCGPFVSMFLCHETARKMKQTHSLGSTAILSSLYMDDLMSGQESLSTAMQCAKEISEVMAEAGFPCHKWLSNEPKALQEIPQEQHHTVTEEKILGVHWDTKKDTLTFKSKISDKDGTQRVNIKEMALTKRSLLSQIARTFDVLGLLSAFIIAAKIMLQTLWNQGLDWDDQIEDAELKLKISTWCEEFENNKDFKIKRRLVPDGYIPEKIVAFSDASLAAYSCAVYLVSKKEKDPKIKVSNLVMAKAKVRPKSMKNDDEDPITIVRLELMGMVLAAKAAAFVGSVLEVEDINVCSDSQINLYRLLKHYTEYKVWTATRLKKIHEKIKPGHIWYTPSKSNSADLNTKGLSFQELMDSKLWWHGPDFVLLPTTQWQRVTIKAALPDKLLKLELPAKSYGVNLMVKTSEASRKTYNPENTSSKENESGFNTENPVLNRILNAFESWHSTLKLTFWIMKILNKFLRPLKRVMSQDIIKDIVTEKQHHSVQDIKKIELWWFKQAQEQDIVPEYEKLIKKVYIKNSKLSELRPTMEQGLIRADLRTKHLAVLMNKPKPPILPKHNDIIFKYVLHVHKSQWHAGVDHTLATIREQFWLVGGRREVQRILRRCLCKKPTSLYQQMAPLPALRGDQVPWKYVSTDLFGPLIVKESPAVRKKMYGSIFVCLVTRAIHLELILDMSTQSFLYAFQKQVARKGKPDEIFSDNAKYYERADKEIKKLYKKIDWKKVQNHAESKRIQWHFTEPLAPWQNAASERNIQTVKKALIKSLGHACVDRSQLEVVMAEIEAMVNDRPLGVSGESTDVITPSMLCSGRRLGQLPDTSEKVNHTDDLNKMWFYKKRLTQQFWKIWRNNYLLELGVMKKWKKSLDIPVQVGQIVQINDPNMKKHCWKNGRIEALHKGRDGQIRSATLKTPNSATRIRRHLKLLSLYENV